MKNLKIELHDEVRLIKMDISSQTHLTSKEIGERTTINEKVRFLPTHWKSSTEHTLLLVGNFQVTKLAFAVTVDNHKKNN